MPLIRGWAVSFPCQLHGLPQYEGRILSNFFDNREASFVSARETGRRPLLPFVETLLFLPQ